MSQTRNSRVTIKLEPAGKSKLFRDIQEITVNKNDTWYQVLNNRLEYMVPLDSGVYITCKRYNTSRPTRGQGWKAKLSEKVGKSLEKFKKKCPLHLVRVWNPNHINPTAQANAGPSNDTRTNNQEQNDNNSSRRETFDWNTVYDNPDSVLSQDDEDFVRNRDATMEVDDLKSVAIDAIRHFPNSVFLDCQKELQRLRNEPDAWGRFLRRAPAICGLLRDTLHV